jgi:hypothetical protein
VRELAAKLKLTDETEVRMRASASGRSGTNGRGEFLKLLALAMIAGVAGGEGGAQADGQGVGVPVGDCAGLRVIQGRITAIDGSVVTVKCPDGFPGGPGIHAQFVMRGPEFRLDIAASRILHPDGKEDDKQPLAVGERVVAVLNVPGEASGGVLAAAVVERVSTSDRVVTH